MAVSTPVRVGLIGCGGNQRGAHVPRLLRLQESGTLKLVAACDPVEKNRDLLLEKAPGLATYDNHRDMLAQEQLDAVVISTPHTLHREHIMDSFAAGCHVLTEKPMVCSVAEAQEVLAKRDETGLVLQVGYQRHFSAGYRWARRFIADGKAGAVRFVSAWQCQAWYKGQTSKDSSWRIQACHSGGGQLNDSGSHMVDILLWVTGLQPTAVSAMMDNRGLEVDVLSSVSVRCDGDALINIAIVGDSVGPMDEEVVIWCDKAQIQIRGAAGRDVGYRLDDAPNELVKVGEDELEDAGDPDADFIHAVLGRNEPQVPGECGLKVIQLSEAAWESARSGRQVAVER